MSERRGTRSAWKARQERQPSWLARLAYHLALNLARGLLAVLVIVGGGVLAYEARHAGRIYSGVSIMGIPVGGLTHSEALQRLEEAAQRQALGLVRLEGPEEAWELSLESLGAHPRLEEAVQAAWNLGRSGVFRYDLQARWQLLWWGYAVSPSIALEPGPATIALRRIARQVNRPARRAGLALVGVEAQAREPEAGREVDIVTTRLEMERLASQSTQPQGWGQRPRLERLWRNELPPAPPLPVLTVSLTLREVAPPEMEVAATQQAADLALAEPLMLHWPASAHDADDSAGARRSWLIDQATLAGWLQLGPAPGEATVQVALDHEAVAAYLADLAQAIDRPPRDGRYTYDPASQQLETLVLSQPGYALDTDAAVEAIADAVLSAQRRIALPVRVIPARVSRNALEAMLPLTLISEGESQFAGSTTERLQNIRVAAERFHGVVVPPEATFSFLEHLGAVTAATGYSESWVIYGDRTMLGPGGGVCQVSTTAFRAAFWGGYPIVERWPHSYRVGWYEPPLGLDAAVYVPSADMRFHNDTATPLLIMTEVNEAQAKLYFRFYGAPTGRTVRMEGPETGRPVAPGPAVTELDPSLPPGARIQVETAKEGLDVTVYRVIEREGAPPVRERFFSRYRAWPARFRVGPASSG